MIEVAAELVSPEASQHVDSLFHVLTQSSLRVLVCRDVFLLDTSRIGLPPCPSVTILSVKALSPNKVTF